MQLLYEAYILPINAISIREIQRRNKIIVFLKRHLDGQSVIRIKNHSKPVMKCRKSNFIDYFTEEEDEGKKTSLWTSSSCFPLKCKSNSHSTQFLFVYFKKRSTNLSALISKHHRVKHLYPVSECACGKRYRERNRKKNNHLTQLFVS